MRSFRYQIAVLLFLCAVASAQEPAQITATSNDGSSTLQGLSLPAPAKTGKLGTKTPLALAEITALLKAASMSSWKDLQATGTMTFPAGDTHPTALMLSGSGYSRLDITMDSGVRSLRLKGPSGLFQSETGSHGVLPAATSMAGVLALPRIWADAVTNTQVSLFDAGSYTVSGKPLHRITIEYPLGADDPTSSTHSVATDLYFDPATHLLLYSVDAVVFSEAHTHTFNRVTSYGSYQQLAGVFIPTSIQQSIDGQLQWTLQIIQLTLNSGLPTSTFSF